MKLNVIKYVIISLLLFINKSVFAEIADNINGWMKITTTSVFCANKHRTYHWLDNETVSGYWKEYTDFDSGYEFYYFYLTEGVGKYNELKNKCIEKFGNDFIYPQPADHRFSNWYPFAKNQTEMFPSARIDKSYVNYKTPYNPK